MAKTSRQRILGIFIAAFLIASTLLILVPVPARANTLVNIYVSPSQSFEPAHINMIHPSSNASVSAIADTFTAQESGYVSSVDFEMFVAYSMNVGCGLTCYIEGSVGSVENYNAYPNDVILSTSTTNLYVPSLPTTNQQVTFNFPEDLYVTAGSNYSAVVVGIGAVSWASLYSSGMPFMGVENASGNQIYGWNATGAVFHNGGWDSFYNDPFLSAFNIRVYAMSDPPLPGTRVVTVRDWGYPIVGDKAVYCLEDLNTSDVATGTATASITVPCADYVQIGYTSMLDGQFYHFMSPWDSAYHANETIELPSTYNVEYFLVWTNYTMTVNASVSAQCSSIFVNDNTNGEAKTFTTFPSYFTFFPNDNISTTATPNSGFAFRYWDSSSHTTQPYSANVYNDITRTAYFTASGGGGGGGGGVNGTPTPKPTMGSGGGFSDIAKAISDFLKNIPWWAIWVLIAILLIAGAAGVLKGKKRGGSPSRSFTGGGM